MKPKLNTLTKWVDGQFGRMQRRFRRSRSGSVLIMVVALLVLLALMGTAYLATARQDRLSAGMMRDTGVTATAARAAADALAQAGTWLSANASQTFTSVASGSSAASQLNNVAGQTANPGTYVEGGMTGPIVMPRVPDLAPVGGPYTTNPGFGAPGTQYNVRWPHLTTPPGFTRMASPIPAPTPANKVNNFDTYQADTSLKYYAFNDAQDWAVPTSMTITYPTSYKGTPDLAGQTRTFPAFMKYTWDLAATPNQTVVSGPYLAADTTGGGIADAGLIPLDIPSTNGVQWFAAWRIVDNAAALNLNTAWGPYPYPFSGGGAPANGVGGTANQDVNKNALNFFPADVDLFGFLNKDFSSNNSYATGTTGAEMATLQARRVVPANGGTNADGGLFWSGAWSENFITSAYVNHSDVGYLTRGEAMWWHLGRRPDFPIAGPAPGVAGDLLSGLRRPFDDTDTVALGYHGVMTDPASPQSKIEQIFSKTNTNPATGLSDSVYRGAMNYMANSADRYDVLPANAIAYWYDWNYNFEGYTLGSLFKNPSGGWPLLGIGIANGSAASDSFAIGGALGQVNFPNATPLWVAANSQNAATAWTQLAFRTPRALEVGANPTLNVARQVDPGDLPDVTQKLITSGFTTPAQFATLPTPPVAMSTYTTGSVPRKVSLNTGSFEQLWRAFTNVFNDFRQEDGNTATGATGVTVPGTYRFHLMRDKLGYDLRDTAGPNPAPVPGTPVDPNLPFTNPRQLRNPMRDPNGGESASSGGTSPGNSAASLRAWLDSRNTAVLRAAIAAVNVLTMRDQHGMQMADATLPGTTYFSPYVAKRAIELKVQTGATAQPLDSHPVIAYVYGGAPQPYITEVYVSNDNSTHKDPTGGGGPDVQNKNGLVVLKLYNPYPFAISLQGYDLAVADRSAFGTGLNGTPGGMTVKLISRAAPAAQGKLFVDATGNVMSVPANGYLMVTNFDAATGYWPRYSSPGWPVQPTTASPGVCIVPGLGDVIGGTAPVDPAVPNPLTAGGGELILLRPLSPDGSTSFQPQPLVKNADGSGTPFRDPVSGAYSLSPVTNVQLPEVPVDGFDCTGMKLGTADASGNTNFFAWHYLRMSGRTGDADTVTAGKTATPWKFIYPGPYSGSGTFSITKTKAAAAGYSGPAPHFADTDVAQWQGGTSGATEDPWVPQANNTDGLPPSTITNNATPTWHVDVATSAVSATCTYQNPFPGIQIFNIDFGGFNKRNPAANGGAGDAVAFPYGGFARVGDVQQVPFAGSYVIFTTNQVDGTTPLWPPQLPSAATAVTVAECNPVTIDTDYVDDGDTADDAYEQLGRFAPMVAPALLAPTVAQPVVATADINDLASYGTYSPNPQIGAPYNQLLEGPAPDLSPNAGAAAGTALTTIPLWRYHFALEVFNQFTVVANPGQDYFPNVHPDSWYLQTVLTGSPLQPANNAPAPVPNTGWAGVEGLININTADWRTLSSVEMVPRSLDADGSLNRRLAKAIVYYRDVDDGVIHQQLTWDATTGNWLVTSNPNLSTTAYRRGHGPFNSLEELNNVWEPSGGAPTFGFRNGMGTIASGNMFATSLARRNYGYFTPGGPNPAGNLTSADAMLQNDDWLGQNLMVDRVSNLLTTRSDSFTVYVVVQGWRNAYVKADPADPLTKNGPWPELVVEKRMAMTVDRSVLTPNSRTLKETAFPTK